MRLSSGHERAAFLSRDASPRPIPSDRSRSNSIDSAPLLEARPSRDLGDGLLGEPKYRPSQRWRWRLNRLRRLVSGVYLRRRSKGHVLLLVLKCLAALVFLLAVFTPLLAPSYLRPPAHYGALASHCRQQQDDGSVESLDGCANPRREKVFVCASLYDKAGHLAGGRWGAAVLELIHILGPDNVFLSIYENNSGGDGATALEHLRQQVPCRSQIVYEDDLALDLFPNVTLPDGSVRTKRLAYLSEVRNRALRPLDTLASADGIAFDRILFLNDVAFRPLDAAQLLFSTNVDAAGRAQYLSACALDWKHPYLFYDVYAQRDAEGFSNGLPLYPIFSAAGSGLSRADMLAQTDAVRVKSCWGGMVAMQAALVQNTNTSLPRPDFQAVGSHVIDPDRPTSVAAPVRFRHEPEIFLDACECCLFLADVSQAARTAGMPPAERGVFVNPYVRVAYDWDALKTVPVVQRWERLFAVVQAVLTWFASLPTHNPHRLVQEGDAFLEEVWDSSAKGWRLATRTGRSGMFCAVREMQLLQQGPRTGDRNWANAAIPPGQTLDFPS